MLDLSSEWKKFRASSRCFILTLRLLAMQQLDLQDTDLFQTDKGKRFTQANTNDRATSSKWKFSIWFFWEVLSLLFLFLHYWYLTFVFLSGNKINKLKKKSYQLCTVILGKEECWTTHCMNIFLWSRLIFSLTISLRVVSHWLICIYMSTLSPQICTFLLH